MATLEETRYIANTVIPDAVTSSAGGAGSMLESIPALFWLAVIVALIGFIVKLRLENRKSTQNFHTNVEIIEKFSHAANGTEIEKVFKEICKAAKGEYLAMYTHRDEWYGLTFELNVTEGEKHVCMPLLISTKDIFREGEKSGNFFITSFVENNQSNIVRIYTRDNPLQPDTDLYRQIHVLCENGIKLHGLVSMELSSERQARIAAITTKLSSSFLSWQYDRERFFFFISNIIMKAIRALEVVIHDEKNNHSFHYGKKDSQGVSKEFYIHHSGCRMSVVTSKPLEPGQLNTIGGFVDSSYSLFVQEEDNLKNAEQFLQFLIHSNEAMELEFPYFNHHSDLVGAVALRLAQTLQIESKTVKSIEIAAKIHDIGMIADVSFSLGKEDKLTESEMDTIRNHPLYGSIIVEPLNQIYPIGDLIKYHHERYDGQGYPLGLLGDEIPLAAYILGFAEHFIGLISDRSYRPGKPFGKAADEVKKLSGQAFHPVVIRAFEENENDVFADLSFYKPNLVR
ncbi:HD-GYP domain-containing protein [Sulfuricurvum sp.]|uniref:HD-GYP domain-containing protein n=1 Tax=Sulfuricurvum sp. TaxID=2025608 RepID=UPI003C5CB41D